MGVQWSKVELGRGLIVSVKPVTTPDSAEKVVSIERRLFTSLSRTDAKRPRNFLDT
jgi:hypothetical protein